MIETKQLLLLSFLVFISLVRGQIQGEVIPLLDCVVYHPDTKKLDAFFGYASSHAVPVIIGEDNNFFFPGPPNRNQPTVFQPGVHEGVFFTSFDVNSEIPQLTWVLDQSTATASNDTALYCNNQNCSCRVGPMGPPGPEGPPGPKGEDGKDGKDGAQGAQGPPGVNGTNGTNGKDGVNGTCTCNQRCRIVTVTKTPTIAKQLNDDEDVPEVIPEGTYVYAKISPLTCGMDAIASCNPGEYMMSGGGECSFPMVMRKSKPASLTSWIVGCLGIKTKSSSVTANAVCCLS